MIVYGGWKHLKTKIAFSFMNLPMPRSARKIFARLGGVQIKGEKNLIGKRVSFDSVHPEKIIIYNNVHITNGCVLLTHYIDTRRLDLKWLSEGELVLKENAFIGTNTIITRPITIGANSIVAAGSVVTKDIPDNEIWGGNPAKFIKKRGC